jgi:pimeloyl-ACP methyl ester carboxylesterase
MPFLKAAGLKTHYAHRQPVSADRPTVVFVHGAGGTHQHWLYQVRDIGFSATYAVDLPGHGRSEGQGRDRIPAYTDWLAAFLDEAGLDRVILVGHSMGGGIALDTALRYPDRVAGLGLVATGARLRVAPAILEAIRQAPEAASRLICDWTFGPEAPPEMVRLGRRQMGQTPADVLLGDFTACDTFDMMDRLGEVASPAFVLCGTQDQLTPPKYATYLQNHMPNARLHLVEGAGHMVMIEQPQSIVKALTALLEQPAIGPSR